MSGRKRLLTRRRALFGLGAGFAGLASLRLALPWWWRARPLQPLESLSTDARALVAEVFADVDRSQLLDVHAHVVGFGTGGSGCWVAPEMQSHFYPARRFQFDVYLSAAGVTDRDEADAQYLSRLFAMQRAANPEGRLMLLAFDYHVNEQGEEVPELSTFHTPNEYVLELAEREPDVIACASVHPYRKDALERLERVAARGARAIKWLPNAMGIDPANPRCAAYYAKLAELDLVLLSHTGLEKAVHAEEAQELGNPLRLRAALDAGVKVIAAHCASTGSSRDLDRAQAEGDAAQMESFDLLLRLFGEKQYEGRLFGDISTLTQINRCGRPLRELLAAPELHARLVNGSDYPLPAIDPLYSTYLLVRRGYISARDRELLNELFRANPLLFDYALKRRVAAETPQGPCRFQPVVFESLRVFQG